MFLSHCHVLEPGYLGMAEHLPAVGRGERILCFALLMCGFCFTCKTAFISASSFLTFPFPVLSPRRWEE